MLIEVCTDLQGLWCIFPFLLVWFYYVLLRIRFWWWKWSELSFCYCMWCSDLILFHLFNFIFQFYSSFSNLFICLHQCVRASTKLETFASCSKNLYSRSQQTKKDQLQLKSLKKDCDIQKLFKGYDSHFSW